MRDWIILQKLAPKLQDDHCNITNPTIWQSVETSNDPVSVALCPSGSTQSIIYNLY